MIIVDTRERYSIAARIFFESHDIEIHETCLEYDFYTDYIISNGNKTVGIQRKSLSEVIEQMTEIRERIHNILKIHDRAILLVEEDFEVSENGFIIRKLNDKQFETRGEVSKYYNFLQSIRDDGICVITTRGFEQSMWWMLSTHKRLESEHVPKIHVKNHTPLENAYGMLYVIDGFGPKICEKLLQNYSIADMCSMNDIQLKSIGMNKKQVDNFLNVVDVKKNRDSELFYNKRYEKCNFSCGDCKFDYMCEHHV